MASERRTTDEPKETDTRTRPARRRTTPVKPPPAKPAQSTQPARRQFQIVIVNRKTTPVIASVFAEDGTTSVSVKLAPSERSDPYNTERITPYTKRLRDKGHVRLETIS